MSSTEGMGSVHEAGRTAEGTGAPWRWIAEAVGVYRRQLAISVGYGLLFVVIGYGLFALLVSAGLISAMPMALGAFALVGPLMAAGLYAVARVDDLGGKANLGDALFPRAASPTQIAYLGVILLVAVFFWTVVAAALFAIFHAAGLSSLEEFTAFALTTPRGLSMIAVGSVLGGLIAFGIFSVSAFSIPMLMDRHVDFATAIGASVQTVKTRPAKMILWAWVIALFTAVGAATFLLGFIFLFPILGYATWIGYRDVFGSTGS